MYAYLFVFFLLLEVRSRSTEGLPLQWVMKACYLVLLQIERPYTDFVHPYKLVSWSEFSLRTLVATTFTTFTTYLDQNGSWSSSTSFTTYLDQNGRVTTYLCASYRFVEHSSTHLKRIRSLRTRPRALGTPSSEVNACAGKDDIESSLKVSPLFSDTHHLNKWML